MREKVKAHSLAIFRCRGTGDISRAVAARMESIKKPYTALKGNITLGALWSPP